MYSLADRIKKLEGRARPDVGMASMRIRYATDPVGYAHHILGVKVLAPDQVAVLRHIAANKRIRLLVPSANETGKSFLAAVICSWFYDCFFPTYTVTTAPAKAQVTQILFRELRRLRRGDPHFSPKADVLSSGPDRSCIGYTAKDATSFQGRHDAHVLVLFDEAEGIGTEFWEAAESFADKFICFYNPTQANSQAAIEERRKSWHVIRMSALNHPNVKAELAGKPIPIPNAVTLAKTIHRLEKWSTIIPEGQPGDNKYVTLAGVTYNPGPVAQARVLGQRPDKPVNAVYSDQDVVRLLPNGTILDLKPYYPIQIGCDVARYGDDFTAIHVRQGPCSLHHESHNGWSVPQIAIRLREIAAQFGGAEGSDVPILIDDCGVGGGVVDLHQGFRFIPVNSGRKADIHVEEDYPNLRSQMFFDFDDLLKHRMVDFSRLPESITHDIVEQLRAAAYELDPRGRRAVLPKKVAKLTLARSPDDADAVLLAYYQFPETLEIHK